MASSKTKRNVALAGLGIGLLFLVAAGYEDEEEEPGSPGGQDPPPDPEEPPEIPFFPGIIFDPPEEPPGPQIPDLPPAPFTPPGEDPWNPTVYEHPENYPTPGMFHQVEYGDIFFGSGSRHNMAWAALYEGAYAAAVENGSSDSEARAFAKHVAGKSSNRARYTNLIQCGPWNDALYGTWGYGEKSWAGPHGRAIRLMPHHPDNRALIMQRKPPLRNIKMRSPNDKGKGNGGAIDNEYRDGFEYLWLPPINPQRLLDTGEITTEGLLWEDGSSMMLPPPEIWALGIDVLEDPGLDEYGCLGAETELG